MPEPVPLREAEAHLAALETAAPARRPGAFRGRIVIGDDFDAPLPDEIATAFGSDRAEPGR